MLGCGAEPEGLVAPEDRRGRDGTGLEGALVCWMAPRKPSGPSLVWHPHPSPPVSDFRMLSPVTVSPAAPSESPTPSGPEGSVPAGSQGRGRVRSPQTPGTSSCSQRTHSPQALSVPAPAMASAWCFPSWS